MPRRNSSDHLPDSVEDNDLQYNNFLSQDTSLEEYVDIRRRYTCYYCGFSVEKFKYIRSHIRRFHIVDADDYAEKPSSQKLLEVENHGVSSPPDTCPQKEKNSPDGSPAEHKDETILPSNLVPPPPPPTTQSKPFNMDLCPYCDFSDKNEKRLRHHILSRHSKELDKIILYECDKKNKSEDGSSKDQKSKECTNNGEKQPPSFKSSVKIPKTFAQVENPQLIIPDEGTTKPQTSDRNQNNILPFTQSLITGGISLSYFDQNTSKTKDECNFKCSNCDFQTFQSWEFLVHTMQNHHSQEQGQLSDSSYSSFYGNLDELDTSAYEIPQEKVYSCIHCHYSTPRLQLLNRHLLSKHSDRRPHKCEHCDYATKRLEHLNRHILSKHSGQKPYQCEYCEYRAARDDHLRNHILSKHSDRTLLRCTNCNYSAVSLEQLNIHMSTKHSDLKCNYTCQLCSYSTSKEEHLSRHMAARHSNMSLYSCDQCDYSCSSAKYLNAHVLTHTMKLPYQCKFCDFGSSRSEDLNTHFISKHKNGRPHVCPECDYRATRLGHLTRHIQTRHSGLKPFGCPQCSYRAGRVEHLHRHMFNKHSDYKPYSCQVCDYTTFREDLLNNHFLSKHNDQGYLTSQFCDIAIKLEEDNELPEKLPKDERAESCS